MSIRWNDIAFSPDDALTADIASSWRWLIGDGDWKAVQCSRLGDLFLERSSGQIDWMSCSLGSIEAAAPDRATFDRICAEGADPFARWFDPDSVAALHSTGKAAGQNECYLFIVLPIFAEGTYEGDNVTIVPVHEVFVGLADIHQQIADLLDGQSVRLRVVD